MNNLNKENYFTLNQLGLIADKGKMSKVYDFIVDKIRSKKVCVGTDEVAISYKSYSSSLRAHHAGYGNTRTVKIYNYFYNIDTLLKKLENKTISFRRKEYMITDILKEYYINEIKTDKFHSKIIDRHTLKELIMLYVR